MTVAVWGGSPNPDRQRRAQAPGLGAARFWQVAPRRAAMGFGASGAVRYREAVPPPEPRDRATLRRAMRSARNALDADTRARAASAVATRALGLLGALAWPGDAAAPVVGVTVADDGELDPGPLVEVLVRRGAAIAPARVIDGAMGFAALEASDALVPGPGGVLQPPARARAIPVTQIGLVLVPVVAFDERCHRIGRGGGHYDRMFARREASTPLLIGLAYDIQRVDDVAPEAHDVPLDHVVTPTAVFSRRSR